MWFRGALGVFFGVGVGDSLWFGRIWWLGWVGWGSCGGVLGVGLGVSTCWVGVLGLAVAACGWVWCGLVWHRFVYGLMCRF